VRFSICILFVLIESAYKIMDDLNALDVEDVVDGARFDSRPAMEKLRRR